MGQLLSETDVVRYDRLWCWPATEETDMVRYDRLWCWMLDKVLAEETLRVVEAHVRFSILQLFLFLL